MCFSGCMGDTQFHFRIRCSPRSCQKSHLVKRYEDEVPLAYRVWQGLTHHAQYIIFITWTCMYLLIIKPFLMRVPRSSKLTIYLWWRLLLDSRGILNRGPNHLQYLYHELKTWSAPVCPLCFVYLVIPKSKQGTTSKSLMHSDWFIVYSGHCGMHSGVAMQSILDLVSTYCILTKSWFCTDFLHVLNINAAH